MITVDYKDRTPIYMQIIKNVEKLIALGVLKKDEKLPSVRNLATELSINPNTIQKAYSQLEAKGSIYIVKGVGNFVSQSNKEAKDNYLDKAYEEIEKKLLDAINYGLDEKTYNKWEKKLRSVFENDYSKKCDKKI